MPLLTLIAPLALWAFIGASLALAAPRISNRPGLTAAGFALAIAAIYLSHEGFPPLPPVAAKQKLAYLLAATALLLLFLSRLRSSAWAIPVALFLLAAFVWLVQRRLFAGSLQIHWILPLLGIAVLSTSVRLQATSTPSPHAWPVTLLLMSVTASFVALLGGFLGMGQVLISVSALLGGATFVVFLDTLRGTEPAQPRLAPETLASITASLGLLLILIGTYATNLSTPAYLLVLALPLLPLANRHIAPRPGWAHPFLFTATGLLAAGPAITLAVQNF